MTCKTCKYFIVTEELDASGRAYPVNECRKYAPRVVHGAGTGWSDQIFPRVSSDDWCGEYEECDDDTNKEDLP